MILVTGGTGFLGYHLLKQLTTEGNSVRAIHRKHSNPKIIQAFPMVDWMECDVLDLVTLREVFQGISHVYHCAATVSFVPADTEMMMQINVGGTQNIVNLSLEYEIQKLIYVSSIAALGRPVSGKEISEKTEWAESKLTSPYSKSKYASEMEVWRAGAEGLNMAIVNPSVIMGEWDWNYGTAQFFQRAWKEPTFYTEGITGFVDVKDVVRAMMLLMESNISNERFVLNSENVAYRQIFDWIAEGFNKKKASRKASPLLSACIWRVDAVRAFLTRSKPLITRYTAASAQSQFFYRNEQFLEAFPTFEFVPIREMILRVCQSFSEGAFKP